ncbi:CAMK/TSSK protein kinase, partial [Aphelenchoides avenae]
MHAGYAYNPEEDDQMVLRSNRVIHRAPVDSHNAAAESGPSHGHAQKRSRTRRDEPNTSAAAAAPVAQAAPPGVTTRTRSAKRAHYDQQPAHVQECSKQASAKAILAQAGVLFDAKCDLGNGRYSKVIRGTCSRTGVKVAIKMIDISGVTPIFKDKFLPREINLWKQVQHPHIVRLFQEWRVNDFHFLITELAEFGDMLAYVQQNGAVPEYQSLIWMRQLMSAVTYLHSMKIVHRDLKLENILIGTNSVIKLADFGFSRQAADAELSKTYCGSKAYSAPEILLGTAYNPYKADVWSLGVVAFVMTTNRMPFSEDVAHNSIIVDNQRKHAYAYPSKLRLSDAFRATVDRMLTFEEAARPWVGECQSLPWFRHVLP